MQVPFNPNCHLLYTHALFAVMLQQCFFPTASLQLQDASRCCMLRLQAKCTPCAKAQLHRNTSPLLMLHDCLRCCLPGHADARTGRGPAAAAAGGSTAPFASPLATTAELPCCLDCLYLSTSSWGRHTNTQLQYTWVDSSRLNERQASVMKHRDRHPRWLYSVCINASGETKRVATPHRNRAGHTTAHNLCQSAVLCCCCYHPPD